MKVSVIIPAYNQAAFIAKAVHSVLQQPEVVECIIVDDGSTDETERIILNLAAADERVKLLHHPRKRNLGSAASRNLGLQNARAPFIGFLDADDYFVDHRYKHTFELFTDGVMAVSEAIAAEEGQLGPGGKRLTSMENPPKGKSVFFEMEPFGKNGYFSICGLTLRRELIPKIGYFDTRLKLTQDTAWLAKLVLSAKIAFGHPELAVAIRGIHAKNSTKNLPLLRSQRVKMCLYLLEWLYQNGFDLPEKERVLNLLLKYHFEWNMLQKRPVWKRKSADLILLRKLNKIHSELLSFPRAEYFKNLVLRRPLERHFNFYE